jgi:hypothetical protein
LAHVLYVAWLAFFSVLGNVALYDRTHQTAIISGTILLGYGPTSWSPSLRPLTSTHSATEIVLALSAIVFA